MKLPDHGGREGGPNEAPATHRPTARLAGRTTHRITRRFAGPWTVSVETLILAAALLWTLTANTAFFTAALKDRAWADPATWGFALALGVGLMSLHVLLLSLLAHRWTVKPLLSVMLLATAAAGHYMSAFGVYLDPTMLRNVLRTNPGEAVELLTPAMALHLTLFAGLPIALLWRVRLAPRRSAWRAVGTRLGLMALATVAAIASLWSVFQPLSSLMRNHKEVRYLMAPANVLWSAGVVLSADARGAARPRQPIGEDAQPGPSWASRQRPLVVLLVVGETARSANWGLSGAARQTTPALAALPVISLPKVRACGTNTETSLPCMFAPVGRRDYDEERIRGQESLLHVAARAGVAVHWRDNQSGCKGVCEGLPGDTPSTALTPALCPDGRCLDEALIHDLDQRLAGAKGTQLWVLHMMGSHGPSYFRRYPESFARFKPDCREDDLRKCSVEEVRNAYDNSLLYTDHVLAATVRALQARADRVDTAMIYVSDHGESLGENGLFLHGVPYAIAPDVQTQVPMVVWTSPGLEPAAGLRPGCLKDELARKAHATPAHDHLFHTVLGLLDVRTALHEPAWDLASACRPTAEVKR